MTKIHRTLATVLLFAAVASSIPMAGAGAQEMLAPTLYAPDSPTKAPGADGFIQRWMILEPIPVSGRLTDSAVRETVETEYFPDQLTVLPEDGDMVSVGDETLTWHAVDTDNYNVNFYHFAYALEKPTSNVLFWVVTVVNAPRDLENVRLAIGSNAGSIWWVNGEEVIGLYNDRQTVVDDGVSKRITLKEGPNVIRAAIINAGGHTDFCARILDEEGDPVEDFTISLTAD
jgi:hypothetical protein